MQSTQAVNSTSEPVSERAHFLRGMRAEQTPERLDRLEALVRELQERASGREDDHWTKAQGWLVEAQMAALRVTQEINAYRYLANSGVQVSKDALATCVANMGRLLDEMDEATRNAREALWAK